MLILSQLDPRWSQVKLGATNVTVAKSGCLTTCISMASDWFGLYKDPGACAQSLSYTVDALLNWDSIKSVFVSFGLMSRVRTYNQHDIDNAIANPNTVCLLNVDQGGHWVVALSRLPLSNTYWVADPWGGKRRLYSGVVGYAVIGR